MPLVGDFGSENPLSEKDSRMNSVFVTAFTEMPSTATSFATCSSAVVCYAWRTKVVILRCLMDVEIEELSSLVEHRLLAATPEDEVLGIEVCGGAGGLTMLCLFFK